MHEFAHDVDMNQLLASLNWRSARLPEVTSLELARIYRLRQEVFTIEQNCVYLDADEADEQSYHLAAWSSVQAQPLAYARLVDPGIKYVEPSMGRVVTAAEARGTGLGRELVKRVLALSDQLHPGMGVRISAQSRLRRFYNEFGFEAVGVDYMEDGIPHIEMLRRSEV
jgi:ElaA protein